MKENIVAQISGAITNLEAGATKDNIEKALNTVDFMGSVTEDQKTQLKNLFSELTGKIIARGGTPTEAFTSLVNYEPNWIVDFFLKIFEIFGYRTERVVIREINANTAPLNLASSQKEILAEIKKHLIKDRAFEVVEKAKSINGSWNQSGKAKKAVKGDEEARGKHEHEWYFKSYKTRFPDKYIEKSRREVLANEMLRIVLGEEKTTKYRVAQINRNEHVISKECGRTTLGEHLGYKTPNEVYSSNDYYQRFDEEIKDEALLKEFIKLNLTCLYLIRGFDLHPFNIVVNLDESGKMTGFIPIDFGSALQATHGATAGKSCFKNFLQALNQPELVRECMTEVKDLIEGKREEIQKHRDLCAAALELNPKVQGDVKRIWTQFTAKLEDDCMRGQISI